QVPLVVAEAREVVEHERHAGVRRAELLGPLQRRAERLFGLGVVPLLIEPRAPLVLSLPGVFAAHGFPRCSRRGEAFVGKICRSVTLSGTNASPLRRACRFRVVYTAPVHFTNHSW